MTTHQLAIAKASFSAGLLRPDPTSLSREDISDLHNLLNTTVSRCSPQNVQKCKRWIFANVAQSTARCAALCKYLTAWATSFTEGTKEDSTSTREPSVKRRRLHILYLLNDILHHGKYLVKDASICSKIQPSLVSLFSTAALSKDSPKHHHKLQDLLNIWDEKGYYSADYIEKLRESIKNAIESGSPTDLDSGNGEAATIDSTRSAKQAPYIMPAMHGDPATPWFDLPAGNLMPHIVPNSTRPINPDMIRPLQFVAGPADEKLVLAVRTLLEDVDRMFGADLEDLEVAFCDIDELGQPIILDEITGDVLEGEGYYGWSRSFCERMKQRGKGVSGPNAQSRSRSRSRSLSVGRKRRYSDSDDSRASGRGRRQRRRSYSSSRSVSREDETRLPAKDYSRSSSRSPRRVPSNNFAQQPESHLPSKPPQPTYPTPQMMFPQGIHPSFPPPPPPPFPPFPNQGNWIPPPPPPPMHTMPYNGQYQQSWPPPPPPPPPGPSENWQAQSNQGRGFNQNEGWRSTGSQGRGGRGDYRGRGW